MGAGRAAVAVVLMPFASLLPALAMLPWKIYLL